MVAAFQCPQLTFLPGKCPSSPRPMHRFPRRTQNQNRQTSPILQRRNHPRKINLRESSRAFPARNRDDGQEQ